MRRTDREITDPAAVTAIMARCQVVRLALNTDGAPYILPLNFGMEPDGMTLYIHGAMEGEKYRHMEADNRAGFEMDAMLGMELDEVHRECSTRYESVAGWGELEEITGAEEKRHALKRIMAQYHWADFPFSEGPLPRTRVFRLNIRKRTGKARSQ